MYACAVTRWFVKVNQLPYLAQLDLVAEVRFEDAIVAIDKAARVVRVTLPKVARARWPQLTATPAGVEGGAPAIVARRAASIEERAKWEADVRVCVCGFWFCPCSVAFPMQLVALATLPQPSLPPPTRAACKRSNGKAA